MKNKKLKKWLIIIGVLVVVAVGATIGVIALNQNSRRAYVQSVSDLNMGGMSSSQSYTGRVVESAQQKVFAGSGKTIDEVFVKEGDKVKKGDKLFQYDTRLLELNVEEKQLTVTISETSLSAEQQKLETYKNIVPVAAVVTEAPEEVEEPAETEVDPSETTEIPEDEEVPAEEPAEENAETTYTAQEKADLITNQELAVSRAQNQLESAQQALEEAQSELSEAVVTAKLDGTVESIQSIDSVDNSAPFCTIIGNTGVTLKGYVGEFDLSSLHVGDTLTVSSYMTGAMTTAEVLTIGDYPAEGVSGQIGNGNQNSSFYEFTAFMDQSEGFDMGEEVEIVKEEIPEDSDSEETADKIVLSKAYVRTDSKGSYVLKDVDGKLERQDVKIKKGADSEYVEITEGLSLDDMIAFPYGSKGKPGLLTTTEQQGPSIF